MACCGFGTVLVMLMLSVLPAEGTVSPVLLLHLAPAASFSCSFGDPEGRRRPWHGARGGVLRKGCPSLLWWRARVNNSLKLQPGTRFALFTH